MGKLTEQIRANLTESMKARTADRTSTLRMLQAAIKNEQISLGHELSDEEALAVIRKGVKQGLDSVEQYTKGNRPDLASKEAAEIEMLKVYLPPELSDAELESGLRDIIASTGAHLHLQGDVRTDRHFGRNRVDQLKACLNRAHDCCAAAWKPARRPKVAARQMPCWPNPPEESPHA